MLHPTVDDGAVGTIESELRYIHEQIEPEQEGADLSIDRYAITKLAMSLCRFNFTPRLDEGSFGLGREWFTRPYREFLDLRRDVFRPWEESFAAPKVSVSYAHSSLGPKDIEVLSSIFRLTRERGGGGMASHGRSSGVVQKDQDLADGDGLVRGAIEQHGQDIADAERHAGKADQARMTSLMGLISTILALHPLKHLPIEMLSQGFSEGSFKIIRTVHLPFAYWNDQ